MLWVMLISSCVFCCWKVSLNVLLYIHIYILAFSDFNMKAFGNISLCNLQVVDSGYILDLPPTQDDSGK